MVHSPTPSTVRIAAESNGDGRKALAALVPWAVAAVAVLWALIPVVGPMGESLGAALQPAAAMLAGAAVTAVAALWLSRRFGRGFRVPFSAR